MYTLSTLQEYNQYFRDYRVHEKAVVTVNSLLEIFTRNLENPQATPGDTIICSGYSNYKKETVVYPDGIIGELKPPPKFLGGGFLLGLHTQCLTPIMYSRAQLLIIFQMAL